MLITEATIVTGEETFVGSVAIEGKTITDIYRGAIPAEAQLRHTETVNAKGLLLIPGVVDEHVHFREPGLTHKATIYTESRAAAAGGVTAFMEMPNTNPHTTTVAHVEEKCALAAESSLIHYSFYIGATNHNLQEILRVDPQTVCGVKLFMGSSTGSMLVDNNQMLHRLFSEVSMLIATHNESEGIIKANIAHYKALHGDDLPLPFHPLIRSEEACYSSTAQAVELAAKYNTRLHVMHLTTARELTLFSHAPLAEKRITAEGCIPHLWFTQEDYATYGNRIKCNPAIKTKADRAALRQAIVHNQIDTIATDHAPHLTSEKRGNCLTAASGMPGVEHSLVAMCELVKEGVLTYQQLVQKMCTAPCELYRIEKRGTIRVGNYADLVLLDPNSPWSVHDEGVRSKCGWSPFLGHTFSHRVVQTIVNGTTVFKSGQIIEKRCAERLQFSL